MSAFRSIREPKPNSSLRVALSHNCLDIPSTTNNHCSFGGSKFQPVSTDTLAAGTIFLNNFGIVILSKFLQVNQISSHVAVHATEWNLCLSLKKLP